MRDHQKQLGQFFTPPDVARSLVRWVVHEAEDRLLDPACGDGQFLAFHARFVGIEIDAEKAALARHRAPSAQVYSCNFFTWAATTPERFEAAVGNPPFIRYQLFSGVTREQALATATKLGAQFNGLSSSWAPFLVTTASLLKPGGCMAFVVPAEIGHATYAAPLLECLCRNFASVGIVAIRERLFPDLSEDAWLLHCGGFGGNTQSIGFSLRERFAVSPQPPSFEKAVSLTEWRAAGCRLRRFLLRARVLDLYNELSGRPGVRLFENVAHAGIGYVTGANDFFHLRPSEAKLWNLPGRCLRVTVRRSEQLPAGPDVNQTAVRQWLDADEPILLLDLRGEGRLPEEVNRYLSTADAHRARQTYKCRNRNPWYVVPDVRTPDAFLSYMSGVVPSLVANSARCVCTNSVHAVRLKGDGSIRDVQGAWSHPLCQLSCELEGHPLGGGMLKLEPGEVSNTRLPMQRLSLTKAEKDLLEDAIALMRRWRHYE